MVVIFYFIYCLFVLVLKEISKLKKRVAIKNDETILLCFCFYEMVNGTTKMVSHAATIDAKTFLESLVYVTISFQASFVFAS